MLAGAIAGIAAERDQVNPQAGRDAAAALWKQAGITSPIDEIDAAEIYVPFSWFEPMWLENLGFAAEGEGWKLSVEDDGIGIHAGDGQGKPGLGTGIVDALAKQLDATVTTSDSGPGTKVTVVHET